MRELARIHAHDTSLAPLPYPKFNTEKKSGRVARELGERRIRARSLKKAPCPSKSLLYITETGSGEVGELQPS